MLVLILQVTKLFYREPCSVQREILNRLQTKPSSWDVSHSELLQIHDTLNRIVKKRTGVGTLNPAEFMALVRNPQSALNVFHGKTLPINDLERFRRDFAGKNF
jgi:hypothetical protein